MKKPLSLRLLVAGLCGLAPQLLPEKYPQRHRPKQSRHSDPELVEAEESPHLAVVSFTSLFVLPLSLLRRHSECSEESPHFAQHVTNRVIAGIYLTALLLATVCATPPLRAQSIPLTGPQQLVFTGLLGSSNPSQVYAQFNAVQSDASGNLYLLLDQRDGVRLLKTDPTATNILAQTQLGVQGDIGLAMALDPSGNICITGTTTSGALQSTS